MCNLLHYCILDFGNGKKIIYHSEGYIIPTKEKLNFYFENDKPKTEDLDHELGGESLELVE